MSELAVSIAFTQRKAGVGAIGFLYYSGHGAAVKDTNINYLIPVDAKEPGTAAFWDESLKPDDILRLLDGARSAASSSYSMPVATMQLPTKDTNKGLIPVVEQQGMFTAYATAPGRTAFDRGEDSGPYAAALASEQRSSLDRLVGTEQDRVRDSEPKCLRCFEIDVQREPRWLFDR